MIRLPSEVTAGENESRGEGRGGMLSLAPTRLHTLPNGLQVILREDHSAPVTSVQAWCRSGSIDEGRWLGAGLSHVLEHMLFKGTQRRGPGRIDQEVQASGGYMNAYTSFDRTVYWINAPNTGTEVAVDILCDIFQNATLDATELEKELDVIRREMDMGKDDPGRRSIQLLFDTAYTRSPHRFPVIGLPDIFNRITRDDLVNYYRERYAPNNCFFVVVGAFDSGKVVQQIEAAYAGTGSRPCPPPVIPMEPRQTGARESTAEAPVELGHLHMAWHTPDLRHPDTAALDVLSTVLGSGRSSRLYQAVREKSGLVHSVSAWTYFPGQEGMFGVSAVLDGGKHMAAERGILVEVERIQREGMREEELSKAVKQFTVATLSTRKTMEGQAQDLGGSWLVAADLQFSERYLERVKRLHPSDIQRVAREYLTEANRTAVALLPKGTSPETSRVSVTLVEHPVQRFELANGLRLLVREDHRLPFAYFRLAMGGGLLAETEQTAGLTHLMAKMMMKGAAGRSAEEIASEIENVGGSLDTYSGQQSFGASGEVLSEDVALGLNLLRDVALRPDWPVVALEREREVQIAGIRGQRDQLLSGAFRAMRRGLFGAAGFGLEALGEEENVKRFQASDLSALHRRLAVPGNAVLSVFGAVKTEEMRRRVGEAFGDWQKSPNPAMPAPSGLELRNVPLEERDKEQAVIAVGFHGTTLDSADRYPLELIQEALSDMGTRLFMRIRDELGLAYYVGASHFAGRTPGYFALYCGTAPHELERVEAELRSQAAALAADGLSAEELERAQAKVLGQRKIGRQDLGGLAMTAALDELHGLGYAHGDGDDDRFAAVRLEDIRRVAARYLNPERCVVAKIRGTAGKKE